MEYRHGQLLNTALASTNNEKDPLTFQSRLLGGIEKIFIDPFKLIGTFKEFGLKHILLFYTYGELYEKQEFKPETHRETETILRENFNDRAFLGSLFIMRNLQYFMRGVEELLDKQDKQAQAAAQRMRTKRTFEEGIRFLDKQIKIISKKQEVIAAEIKDAEARRDANALYALHQTIAAGRVLEAIGNKNIEETATVMNNPEYREAIDALLPAYPKESIQVLIETAVRYTIDRKSKDNIERAIVLAGNVLRKNPSYAPELIAVLKKLFVNKSSYTIPAEREVRISILKNILINAPEALPHLIDAYNQNYSFFRSIFGLGFENKVLRPLIMDMIEMPEAQDAYLRAAFRSSALRTAGGIHNQLPLFMRGLTRGILGRRVMARAINGTLARSADTYIPSFSRKNTSEKIAVSLSAVTRQNIENGAKVGLWKAPILLFAALKFQQMMEFLREGLRTNAKQIHEELASIGRNLNMTVPHLNLAVDYFEGSGENPKGMKANIFMQKQVRSQIIEASDFNLPLAERIIRPIEGDKSVWDSVPSRTNETQNGAEISDIVPKAIHFIRYAYSFLAARKAQFGENHSKELSAALNADADRKQLFLTLMSIPPAIRDQLDRHFIKQMARTANSELALEVQLLVKLIGSQGINDNIRATTQNILAALEEYGNGKVWKRILRKVKGGDYDTLELETFFNLLIKNLAKKGRDLDRASIKLEIKNLLESIPDII